MAACYDVSGVLASAPNDQANALPSVGSTNPSAATGALSQSNEVVFGGIVVDGASTSMEASGFTTLDTAAVGRIGTTRTAYRCDNRSDLSAHPWYRP